MNPRSIISIVDPEGNKGKSWLTKYMCTQKPNDCILFGNAKTADFLYAYRGQKIAIFDFCRSQEDHLNYMAIESIKNICYFSSKYTAKQRVYSTPHVVLFSNFEHDRRKLNWDSSDVRKFAKKLDNSNEYKLIHFN